MPKNLLEPLQFQGVEDEPKTCSNTSHFRGWKPLKSNRIYERLGGVPQEQKMLKGHLPRDIYHKIY